MQLFKFEVLTLSMVTSTSIFVSAAQAGHAEDCLQEWNDMIEETNDAVEETENGWDLVLTKPNRAKNYFTDAWDDANHSFYFIRTCTEVTTISNSDIDDAADWVEDVRNNAQCGKEFVALAKERNNLNEAIEEQEPYQKINSIADDLVYETNEILNSDVCDVNSGALEFAKETRSWAKKIFNQTN